MAKRVKTQVPTSARTWSPRPRRLALMNLYLHGIEPHIRLGDSIYEPPSSDRFDVVLTNPPFGTKGANQAPERDDFTVATSNKQLNFLQHVLTILKPGGRAAVVLPDNCLFADQAGEVFKIADRGLRPAHRAAAAARHVHAVQPGREGERRLLHQGLRRPRPSGSTTRAPTCPASRRRTGRSRRRTSRSSRSASARTRTARRSAKPSDSKEDRWRSFHIAEVKEREFKLDGFKWLKEESLEDADELPEPEELATDAIEELEEAVNELNDVLRMLENGGSEHKMATK